jgi:hypothetical protein
MIKAQGRKWWFIPENAWLIKEEEEEKEMIRPQASKKKKSFLE